MIIDKITPSWITQRLKINGYLPSGEVADVQLKTRSDSSSVVIYSLAVQYTSNAPATAPTKLIYKHFIKNWETAGRTAFRCYKELLSKVPDTLSPICYDAVINEQENHCYFLLQDVSPTHQQAHPKIVAENQQHILEALIHLHTTWWDHPRISQNDITKRHGGPLRMAQAAKPETLRNQYFDKDLPEWEQDLKRLIDSFGKDISETWRNRCEKVLTQWPDLFIPRVKTDCGLTLIHGDCNLGNIYLPKTRASACLLDWETCKRSVGPFDIAYLMLDLKDRNLRQDIEHTFLENYYHQLCDRGIQDYTWKACYYDYQLSILCAIFSHMSRGPIPFSEVMYAYEDWSCDDLLN